MKNAKKRAITDLNAPNGSRDIPFQSQDFEQDGHRHFVDFLASFLLKYDVTDAILQDIEIMKVQYLMNLVLDLFEILQAVGSEKQISLDFKFRCYDNSNENN